MSILFEHPFFRKAPALASLESVQYPTPALIRSCLLELTRHVVGAGGGQAVRLADAARAMIAAVNEEHRRRGSSLELARACDTLAAALAAGE